MQPILDEDDLDDALSNPTQGALQSLALLDDDVMLLGAGGKMGPTLARMVRRGLDAVGQSHRKVYAVSRFSSPTAARKMLDHGIEIISCDLLQRSEVQRLPPCRHVIFMAGQKFGTSDAPERTWAMNTLVPAHVAEHFSESSIVVFSTGCVYPLVPIHSSGADESVPMGPMGDYSNSCVGRERIFSYFSRSNGTPMLMFRLCYAIDLRYGVLHDVARKVLHGEAVDVTMGAANVIWQGDANARAIQSLQHTAWPPTLLNVTGIERVSIRQLAHEFASLFGVDAKIVGTEADKAWIWDASRSYELFGTPQVSLPEMIEATAQWMQRGGASLGKPTHFEVTDGTF
jgi:nucleoside-diphosphate-sugar epimerase